MKKKLSILKKINDKTAEDIYQKFPADWDMDRVFQSSYKQYIRRRQDASDISRERVNDNMTDIAVDIKLIRKSVLLKTITVIAVLAVTAAAVAVFWTKKKEQHEHKPLVTENYFVDANYTIPECVSNLANVIKAGDRIIISGNIEFSENKSEKGNGLCITDMSGKIISKTKLGDGCIENIYISDNSDIYVHMLIDQYECDENGKSVPADFIEHLDLNGTLIDSTQLDIDGEICNTEMLVDSEGRYILLGDYYDENSYDENNFHIDNGIKKIFLLDTDGSVVSEVKCDDETEQLHIFKNKDGILQLSEHHDITEIRKIDFENKTTEKIAQTNFEMYGNVRVFYGNNLYDFFLAQNDGIYGYNLKDNKLTEIVNYIESDMPHFPMSVWISDENNFLYSYSENQQSDIDKCSMMTRADDETLKKINEKKLFTVAVAWDTRKFWDCAVRFNINSEKYRIKVKNYSCHYNPDNGFSTCSSFGKQNEDMIKGDIADVIICGDEFDISRYASMGTYADFNELMKNDSEISRSDFFENILDAYETDGKLYYMPINFSLNTLSGKMSVLGERDMLTYDEFFDMNNKQSILMYESRHDLMNEFIRNNLSEFVDFSKRKCDFDNKDFTRLLEFIKTSGLSYEESTNVTQDEFAKRVADDRCSCFMRPVDSYEEQSRCQMIDYGDEKDVSYIGMPSKDGGSAVAQAHCMIAISESSDYKDTAWKFVKSLFSEENQLKDEYSFPILKSAFEKQSENVLENQDPYCPETKDLYGKRITLKPVDKDLVQKIYTLTQSVRHAVVADSEINSIINQETEKILERRTEC